LRYVWIALSEDKRGYHEKKGDKCDTTEVGWNKE